MNTLDRRAFLAATIASAPLFSALPGRAEIAPPATSPPPLCVFSKHLQFLSYPELARVCRELGLDGVDLTVRPGGHVLPENVAWDLPEAVAAIRAEGLDVPMITTRFLGGGDAGLRETLTVARQCNIPYFRVGNHRYDESGPILPQLERFTDEVRSLAQVAEELDMVAGYHNHSGARNVGAPLWDLHHMYEAVGSRHLGSNFDVGHAVVEGAYGDWEITARLLAPWVRMMAVKDFEFNGTRPRWTPLGQGVVNIAAFLRIFREHAAFTGPVSLHFEYSVRSNDAMLEEIRAAVRHMRESVYPGAGYDGTESSGGLRQILGF